MAHPNSAVTAARPGRQSWRDRVLALAPAVLSALVGLTLMAPHPARAATALGDQPMFSNAGVPGNLALALSVEYPTAVSRAHLDNIYDSAKAYLGYFDPNKCYLYNYNSSDETQRYFYPAGAASNRTCTGVQNDKWSGNFMNWATMQTIDPFRWALTGGYRSIDTTSLTVLEKAWASGQGGTGNFPDRTGIANSVVANNTPLNWSSLNIGIQGQGNKMRFKSSGSWDTTQTAFSSASGLSNTTTYEVSVRVKVCDANTATAGPLESNCTRFPNGTYKPTGLIQKYASKIRYSTFGYLNDNNIRRDGGVMRARQKFVGPTYTLPAGSTSANLASEWDEETGILFKNPDPSDASSTTAGTGVSVTNSGVINYLNKFGQLSPGNYKTYDNVSELYYAALRYFRNLGDVSEWSSMGSASLATKTTWVDGFPVITNWDDPILYSCQKNFVLGIGDVNTHADKNVPGAATPTANEPTKPAAVAADASVDAVVATNKVGQLHGLGSSLGTTNPINGCCSNNSALIAGLAYDANGKDIRPEVVGKPQTVGKQTVQTYWLDVLEYSTYKANNQYYLATKYGGAKLPENFDPYTRTTDLPTDWWNTTGDTVYGQSKPDNYFTAGKADEMISGLTQAFASIAGNLRAYTTSFSTAAPQVAQTGTASYSAQYDASSWTGELSAATTVFDVSTSQPSNTVAWNFSTKLATQAAGNGWDTGRRIVTWNTDSNGPVPLRLASLSAAQKTALDTVYRSGDDSADYLNYLRGQTLHEEGSTTVGSSQAYRKRLQLVGDIVGSKPRAVGPPSMPFSSATNPGYGSFRTTWTSRKTVVYVGTNAGMLHAVDGTTSGTGGSELFAYVPGALFQGPTNTPQVNGLAARGNPTFNHKYMLDATPAIFDIDLGRTVGGTGTDWRSVLVGGMGKGGKSYFAIDVTNPAAFTSESVVATKVLWEFSHPDLGYTYGEPAAVKTRKYGWVLVFGSGYGNTDGKGYFFIVNPRNGTLLEKISTGVGNTTTEAGLAHVKAFVLDRTDNTADSVYGGDLLGNLWRLDLRAGSNDTIPAPQKLATLLDANNDPRPVTSRPSIIIQPITNTRWVAVGTGQLLDASDAPSAQMQAMYAIKDGTGLGFNATAPTGFSFPFTSSKLLKLTDLTQAITLNTTTQIGWYVELGTSSGQGWRMISDPTSYYGSVEFTTMLPNGDACNPSGSSRVYAIELGTGQSSLVGSDDVTPIPYSTALVGVATEQRSYAVDDGTGNRKRRYVACSSNGGCAVIKTKQPSALGLRRLNWRELPLAN